MNMVAVPCHHRPPWQDHSLEFQDANELYLSSFSLSFPSCCECPIVQTPDCFTFLSVLFFFWSSGKVWSTSHHTVSIIDITFEYVFPSRLAMMCLDIRWTRG